MPEKLCPTSTIKSKKDVAFRKQVAEEAGLGFHLPSKKCVEPKQSGRTTRVR